MHSRIDFRWRRPVMVSRSTLEGTGSTTVPRMPEQIPERFIQDCIQDTRRYRVKRATTHRHGSMEEVLLDSTIRHGLTATQRDS